MWFCSSSKPISWHILYFVVRTHRVSPLMEFLSLPLSLSRILFFLRNCLDSFLSFLVLLSYKCLVNVSLFLLFTRGNSKSSFVSFSLSLSLSLGILSIHNLILSVLWCLPFLPFLFVHRLTLVIFSLSPFRVQSCFHCLRPCYVSHHHLWSYSHKGHTEDEHATLFFCSFPVLLHVVTVVVLPFFSMTQATYKHDPLYIASTWVMAFVDASLSLFFFYSISHFKEKANAHDFAFTLLQTQLTRKHHLTCVYISFLFLLLIHFSLKHSFSCSFSPLSLSLSLSSPYAALRT